MPAVQITELFSIDNQLIEAWYDADWAQRDPLEAFETYRAAVADWSGVPLEHITFEETEDGEFFVRTGEPLAKLHVTYRAVGATVTAPEPILPDDRFLPTLAGVLALSVMEG
jgi:hypothetical protein